MKFLKPFVLFAVALGAGLGLAGCQPSAPKAPTVAKLSALAISPKSVELDVNATQPLMVMASFSDGSSRDVSFDSTFTSSAPDVATVNPQGVVTAVAPGDTTITATYTPSGTTATVSVTVKALRVNSIQVTPSTVALPPGGSQPLTVIATYNSATTGDATTGSSFSSSDDAIATVNAAGVVTAVAAGSTTITVTHTASGSMATVPVTVRTAAPLVYASNYSQVDGTNWLSAEGGAAGTYIDTSVPTQYWWNGVSPGDATPSFYFGYGINVNSKPWGFGAFVAAPGNGTANITGYSHLQIAVWGNDELMNTHPTLTLLLKGPTVSGCTPVLQSTATVSAPGVQTYLVPLSSFTLQSGCDGISTVAEALAAGVAEVHVQVLGDNVQYVTGGTADGFYPNGLNIGPISFISGIYSSNYGQVDATNWVSAEGGAAGTYIDTSVPSQYWWNGVSPTDATPSFYFGYGINVNSKPWGFGAFVNAPGNGTFSVAGYSHLKIAVWGNDELMNTHPTLTLVLKGPTASGCAPVLQSTVQVSAPGVQTYLVPLSSFTLQSGCDGISTVAEALAAGVAEVHVQVLGDNVQYVTGGTADGFYPNGLNVGPISFVAGVYASNYAQVDATNWVSAEGGAAGTYIDTSVPTQYWWNGVSPTDATPSFYFGYGINVNSKPWGFGAFVAAPGNGAFSVAGDHSVSISVWGNDELMNTHPTLTLILQGPTVSGCAPVLQATVQVGAAGVQSYTVPLDSFALQSGCDGISTAAQALAAGVAEVHVQVLGDNVQYVTGGTADGFYPNGLNVGPILFH